MPGRYWFGAAVIAYAASALLYVGFALGLRDRVAKFARGCLIVGLLAGACEIGARGIAEHYTVASAGDAVGFMSWLMVGAYLLMQLRFRLDVVGAFVAPTAVIMLLVARLVPVDTPVGAHGMAALGVLGRIHISLVTFGVALFAFAAAAAVLYLFAERQLKRKKIGRLFRKGAALETLDMVVYRCVLVGFLLYTVALATGAVWGVRQSVEIRIDHLIALAAWTTFAGLLFARRVAGWRGRRAAIMTLIGFSEAAAVMLLYFTRAMAGG